MALLLAPSGCGTSKSSGGDAADEFIAKVCQTYDDCCAGRVDRLRRAR